MNHFRFAWLAYLCVHDDLNGFTRFYFFSVLVIESNVVGLDSIGTAFILTRRDHPEELFRIGDLFDLHPDFSVKGIPVCDHGDILVVENKLGIISCVRSSTYECVLPCGDFRSACDSGIVSSPGCCGTSGCISSSLSGLLGCGVSAAAVLCGIIRRAILTVIFFL